MSYNGQILKGDGTWPFLVAVIDGEDIVVRGGAATWFGGSDDDLDSGATASGVSTKDNPNILGCALPMRVRGFKPTQGSPIPRLPWHTQVRVYRPTVKKSLTVELIDLGPAKWACADGDCIDLTQAAMRALCGGKRLGRIKVDYRIIGGAKDI